MTEEEIADIIIKADERFDILTQRHRPMSLQNM